MMKQQSLIGFKQGDVAFATSDSLKHIPYERNALFTDREDILNYLHKVWWERKPAGFFQPQALCGLGGIGKMEIALEYTHRNKDNYHFIFWVNGASKEKLTTDFIEIAQRLH